MKFYAYLLYTKEVSRAHLLYNRENSYYTVAFDFAFCNPLSFKISYPGNSFDIKPSFP